MSENTNPFEAFAEETEVSPVTQKAKSKGKSKRLYWLKLKDGFFQNKYIRVLRSKENGDLMALIYLHLHLKAMKNDGFLEYNRLLPDFTEELALDLNEDIDAVKETVEVLKQMNLLEVLEDDSIFLVKREELVDYGDETDAAERMRKSRANKADKT